MLLYYLYFDSISYVIIYNVSDMGVFSLKTYQNLHCF